MTTRRPAVHTLIVAAAIACLVAAPGARTDVKVEFDKTFDFTRVKSWTWNPERPGEVKMARTADDDPEVERRFAEPIILEVVDTEMARSGMVRATATPDLVITYYLLLTTNLSGQTMGQFLPATTAWGLPPFPPATQSLKMMNRGSLVLDMSANGVIVWRGLAQAQIKPYSDKATREKLLREGIRDLLARFPPGR